MIFWNQNRAICKDCRNSKSSFSWQNLGIIKKPNHPDMTSRSQNGSSAFLDLGSATFCPYLTIGLANVLSVILFFMMYITQHWTGQPSVFVGFIGGNGYRYECLALKSYTTHPSFRCATWRQLVRLRALENAKNLNRIESCLFWMTGL